MKVRCLIFGLTLIATAAARANEPVSIRVSPAVSFAPAYLVIQTRIDPDAANRSVEAVVESEDFYRSSTIPLDGDHAPKTTRFEFRSFPAGDYRVSVVVTGADGRQRAIARTQARVVESGVAR
jgi:hypothetical protein